MKPKNALPQVLPHCAAQMLCDLETSARIKHFNCAALLDFTNVSRPNGPNYDIETSHFAGGCDAKKHISIVKALL